MLYYEERIIPVLKKVVIRLIEFNMIQKELTDEIGCTRQYLHKILVGERSGKSTPTAYVKFWGSCITKGKST